MRLRSAVTRSASVLLETLGRRQCGATSSRTDVSMTIAETLGKHGTLLFTYNKVERHAAHHWRDTGGRRSCEPWREEWTFLPDRGSGYHTRDGPLQPDPAAAESGDCLPVVRRSEKFFPQMSPAQDLAIRTIDMLSGEFVPATVALPLLAAWECLIGIGLLAGKGLRAILFLLYVQMLGTLTPVALFPSEIFTQFPYAPTLEGQYIIKNMAPISAGIVVGATVRGGRIVADPPTGESR